MNGIFHTTGALVMVSGMLFMVSCGGTTASSAPAATGGRAESDYVDALCRSADRMVTAYRENLNSAGATLTGMDPTDAFIRVARDPYSRLAADLAAIQPPADLQADHDRALAEVRGLRDAIGSADRGRVLAMTLTPDTGKWRRVMPLPAALQPRLGPIAQELQSCQELRLHGGGGLFD